MVNSVIISGAESLAEVRSNSAQAMLGMLAQHHYVLNDWMVGVGKSYQLDQLTTLALESNAYDCVIVAAPTRKILEERKPLQSPPADIKVVNIQPRPSKLCGETRDLSWKDYERRNLGLLGKKHICALCPNKDKCFWPDQYGKNLDGAKIVYAT
ncbi:TPA: DNA-binding response regulator, partial [Vibrio parahaemolyticus]|nr:DNA-binding response regulator [Vibrio parahaemolyticus]HCH3558386.1 DNA-binding response regulator [Vibrio parahaemolyticus]